MSDWEQKGLNEKAVNTHLGLFLLLSMALMLRGKTRALAESQHLIIDPSRLEDLPEYPRMIGGFGTIRVARLDNKLVVAVKGIRINGANQDRARFAIVCRTVDPWMRLLTLPRDSQES